jgi:uncharacterized LabA/DUF88 family protein
MGMNSRVEDNIFKVSQYMKTVAFIDGVSMYVMSKEIGYDFDYRRILESLAENCDFLRPYYYNRVAAPTPEERAEGQVDQTIMPLVDYLKYNGYTVELREIEAESDDDGRRRMQGSIVLDIYTDVFRLVSRGKIEQVVLFATNSDYVPLVKLLKDMCIRVVLVTNSGDKKQGINSSSSKLLRIQADELVNLASDEVAEAIRLRRGPAVQPAVVQTRRTAGGGSRILTPRS